MGEVFPCIILNGRPAAGKSEVIDYLKNTSIEERKKRFHIGEFIEIDDFPYIWEWFEEDDILSKYGKERLHSKPDYYFKDEIFWDVCIEKLNLAFAKHMRDVKGFSKDITGIIEFSRGGENGFAHAYSILSDEILKMSGICYIKVSYEESVRKNRRRARKGQEDTVLFHSLPDDKMDFYYKVNDWDKIAPDMDGYMKVNGINVPYAVFPNEPEATDAPEKIAPVLEETLCRLWKRVSAR